MSRIDENLSPLQYKAGVLSLLDQRALPNDEIWLDYDDFEDVADAIKSMVVRGAPAIGCTAAYGVAIGVRQGVPIDQVIAKLAATRPTAVNLFWALERMREIGGDAEALEHAAIAIHLEDIAACRAIGANGAALLPAGTVLTHCNAGALATGGYGTALGVIRSAVASGTKLEVFADETRPFLQGSRLTAWELARSNIPVTVLCDNMAGHFMSRGAIQSVVVGADRIAANGDFANKIGTFTVALLAREHAIPFFVAAPLSTIDRKLTDGSLIPIEERPPREVTHVGDTRLAPEEARVKNPAFDVTPARLVTAIITEAGVARPPYADSLTALFGARVPS